jgi:hypothetical protein
MSARLASRPSPVSGSPGEDPTRLTEEPRPHAGQHFSTLPSSNQEKRKFM